jgi:hypothetical protein
MDNFKALKIKRVTQVVNVGLTACLTEWVVSVFGIGTRK